MALPPGDFAAQAANHLGELNAIHPFREGNGRTLRSFLVVLASVSGLTADLTRIDPAHWLDASRVSFMTGDAGPMREIIALAVQD